MTRTLGPILSTISVLLLAALLAWWTQQHHRQWDWSGGQRHTLSSTSVRLLTTLDGPVQISAYVPQGAKGDTLRRYLVELCARYQRHKNDMTLQFQSVEDAPQQARQRGISGKGELWVEYRGRHELVPQPTEQTLSNALLRLSRDGLRKVLFITGHGERAPRGAANFDVGRWGAQLADKGFQISSLDLNRHPQVPPDTRLLVLASPQTPLLPGEVERVLDYVGNGGNLLWLHDPSPTPDRNQEAPLAPLAERLGLRFGAGTVIDPTTRELDIRNPAMALVNDYPRHPASEGLQGITLLPMATTVTARPGPDWQVQPLLRSGPQTWLELGSLNGQVNYDADSEPVGPLTLGLTLVRTLSHGAQQAVQRIAVIGDGDFLSNTYLGNGVNLALGNRLVEWLCHDDQLLSIPQRRAPDVRFTLGASGAAVLGGVFLVALPLGLLGVGLWLWWRRRHR